MLQIIKILKCKGLFIDKKKQIFERVKMANNIKDFLVKWYCNYLKKSKGFTFCSGYDEMNNFAHFGCAELKGIEKMYFSEIFNLFLKG